MESRKMFVMSVSPGHHLLQRTQVIRDNPTLAAKEALREIERMKECITLLESRTSIFLNEEHSHLQPRIQQLDAQTRGQPRQIALDTAENRIQELSYDLREQSRHIAQLETRLAQFEKGYGEAIKCISQRDSENNQLRETVARLEVEVARPQEALEELNLVREQNAKLRSRIHDLNAQLNRFSQGINDESRTHLDDLEPQERLDSYEPSEPSGDDERSGCSSQFTFEVAAWETGLREGDERVLNTEESYQLPNSNIPQFKEHFSVKCSNAACRQKFAVGRISKLPLPVRCPECDEVTCSYCGAPFHEATDCVDEKPKRAMRQLAQIGQLAIKAKIAVLIARSFPRRNPNELLSTVCEQNRSEVYQESPMERGPSERLLDSNSYYEFATLYLKHITFTRGSMSDSNEALLVPSPLPEPQVLDEAARSLPHDPDIGHLESIVNDLEGFLRNSSDSKIQQDASSVLESCKEKIAISVRAIMTFVEAALQMRDALEKSPQSCSNSNAPLLEVDKLSQSTDSFRSEASAVDATPSSQRNPTGSQAEKGENILSVPEMELPVAETEKKSSDHETILQVDQNTEIEREREEKKAKEKVQLLKTLQMLAAQRRRHQDESNRQRKTRESISSLQKQLSTTTLQLTSLQRELSAPDAWDGN